MATSFGTRPHAVAIPFPAQGHISPLMQLCRALASRGFIITFVNTESNQARMQNIQDDGLDIRYETVPDNLSVPIADFDVFHQDNRIQFFQATRNMESSFETLLKGRIADRGTAVSCIISDVFMDWIRDVAHRSGVPALFLWTASVTSFLLEYHISLLLQNEDIPVEDPSSDKLVTCIPGLSPLPTWSLPYVYRSNEAAYDPGFSRRIVRAAPVKQDPYVLFNTVAELEPQALDAMRAINANTLAIGPLLLLQDVKPKLMTRNQQPSLWKEDQQCLAWLDKHQRQSVLYLSFGSLFLMTVEQAEELAAALEVLGQPYLWSLRRVKGLEQDGFEAFKRRIANSGGLLVSWAPQLEVLMHPSTGGFLTHCGWNSTLESICAGVPMLCWPCVAEQNLNCKLIVEDWKVGLHFSNVASGGLVGRDELIRVVGKLMGDEGHQIRCNAKLLSNKVSKKTIAGSTNLDHFISSLTSSS